MTIKYLAAVTRMSKQAIQKRANKECWRFSEKRGRGGIIRNYRIVDLPADLWIDVFFCGPYLNRLCLAVIIVAVLYFAPVVVRILARF